VIKNQGQTSHEFMIMPSNEGPMDGISMADMDHMALANVPDFSQGHTEILNYRFSMKAAGTHPQFVCYDPGHYQLGMYLAITVSQ
jgi:uncharacterized cupredoxin-like copper-binding protein